MSIKWENRTCPVQATRVLKDKARRVTLYNQQVERKENTYHIVGHVPHPLHATPLLKLSATLKDIITVSVFQMN